MRRKPITKQRYRKNWGMRKKKGTTTAKGTFTPSGEGIRWKNKLKQTENKQNKIDTNIFGILKRTSIAENKVDKEKDKAQLELQKQLLEKQKLETEEEEIKRKEFLARLEENKKVREFIEGREEKATKGRDAFFKSLGDAGSLLSVVLPKAPKSSELIEAMHSSEKAKLEKQESLAKTKQMKESALLTKARKRVELSKLPKKEDKESGIERA